MVAGDRQKDLNSESATSPNAFLIGHAGQDGLNPYAYALNRPTRYVDPSGYQSSVPPIPTITDYWNASGGAYPGVSAVVPFDWSLQLGAQYGQLLQSAQANGLGYALTHSEYVGSWLFQTPMGDRVMLYAQLSAQGVSVASLTLATGAGLGAIVTGSTTLFGMEIGITSGSGASLSASVGATLAEAGPTVAAGAAKAAPTLSSEISALENEVQAVTAEGVAAGPRATLSLANEIAAAGEGPAWARTVGVMETREGVTLVGAGARDLTLVQKTLAENLGLRGVPDMPGIHAEGTLLNGAGEFGLTPRFGVVTNNVCSGICLPMIQENGGWVWGRYFGFPVQ